MLTKSGNADDAFKKVQAEEHAAINKRRALGRQMGRRLASDVEALSGEDSANGSNRRVYDTTGLSLSGGGIRSAAFCLGGLQGLEAENLIGGIDYLSTVSGGGYIGASMSACMSEPPKPDATVQSFPFGAPREYEDREAVGHLRDYSNYLLPRGGKSFLDIVTVLLRGWVTNLVFIFGVLFLLATPTVWAFPSPESLCNGSFIVRLLAGLTGALLPLDPRPGNWLCETQLFSSKGPFLVTGWMILALAVLLVIWAVRRSRFLVRGKDISDVEGIWIRLARWTIVILLAAAWIELQPVILSGFVWAREYLSQPGTTQAAVKALSAAATALSGAVVFFRNQLATFLKASQGPSGLGTLLGRFAAQAAIWVAAFVLPLLIYVLYLSLCAEAMPGRLALTIISSADLPAWLPVAGGYLLIALGLILVISLFAPNANSLHQLYRDKLSKAFLFYPERPKDSDPRDDLPVISRKLADISPATGGPYHLINAALNLQGSKYANRRGRNATFFLFSSKYVGSDVTDYARTKDIVKLDNHLDLGTAMAISGAAVSANMGALTISALSPTLALLNARLGYWMVNPRATIARVPFVTRVRNFFKQRIFGPRLPDPQAAGTQGIGGFRRFLSDIFKFYLISEMFGRLDETSPHIYVTDGGHIENLGLYQLLKRGCRAIIVIDAEADPKMTFHALSIVERYARIDLGARIDLPWEQIGQGAFPPLPQANVDGAAPRQAGVPHCALGIVEYSNGQNGLLLYVKASATGDEADYVLDYRKRNPSFPHETTGDQFFSEEQFEAYRALGFHALQTFFAGDFVWTAGADWASFRNPNTPAATPVTAAELRDCFLAMFK